MSEKNKHTIFTSTDCLSEQTMFDYIDGKLSPKEQHIVEKHLLDCELCSDAIEGLQLLKNRSRIADINKEIDKIINKPERKIFSINYSVVISIAAAFLLLIGGVYFFNHFVSDNSHNNEVSELKAPKEKESVVTPSFENDSVKQTPKAADQMETTGKQKEQDLKSLEDKEPLTTSGKQETEKTAVSEGIADEEIVTPAQPVPDQNNKDIAASGAANQPQTITLDKSIAKNDNAVYEYKQLPEESKNEATQENNAPVEQSVSKNAEKFSALKTEPKKKAKEDKREESQKAAATNIPYAPQSATQMDADQTKATDSINVPEEPVYTKVDKMPEFPGGDAELMKYIQKNIDLTKLTIENENVTGFTIQFVVNSLGQASKAKLLKPASKENEKQIIELINKMPLWTPGKLNGKPVSVLYNLPVKFRDN